MIRLNVLGAPALFGVDGRELRGVVAQPKRFALLAHLALATPRGFQRRDRLLALFWPESDLLRGRNALRQATHYLRQALGDAALVNSGAQEVALAGVWCDAVAFEEALDRGDLIGALELYRGELLPGFFLADAGEFEHWLDEERARLRQRAARGAWTLAEREAEAGSAASAAHWARWAAALPPDDEGALRQLLALLVRVGDHAGAVHAYREFAARLRRDCDAAPAAETTRLVAPLQASPEPAPTRAPAAKLAATAAAAPTSVALLPPPAHPAALAPSAPERARAPWRRRVAVGAIALAGLTGVALLLPGFHRPARAAGRAVAVFPFAVRGHTDLSYLREGLVDLLSTKLDGVTGLRSIDPRAVLAAAAGDSGGMPLDPRRGSQLAGGLGADAYVLGDVVEVAGRLQLTAALFDRTRGETPVARATAEADAPGIFALTDRVAARLLVGFSGGSDTVLTALAGVSTQSLPAFKSYLDGADAFRAGHYTKAMDAFRRAVREDTAFALAYYRLAVAEDWAGEGIHAAASAAQATRHADRLTPLVQALLWGFQGFTNRSADYAERVYHNLSTTRPDNLEAAYMLGEVRFHYNSARGRSLSEARDAFERVLAVEPGDGPTLLHLARIAAVDGRRTDLDTLTGRFLALYGGSDRALEMRALRAYALDDRAEQAQIAAALVHASDVDLDVVTRGVAGFAQDLPGALALAPLYLAPGRARGDEWRGHDLLARLSLAAGRPHDATPHLAALDQVDPGWALATRTAFALAPFIPVPPAEVLAIRGQVTRWRRDAPATLYQNADLRDLYPQLRAYLLGTLDLPLGDWGGARQAAAELDALGGTPGDSDVARDLAHLLRADLDRATGASAAGLREIEQFRFGPETDTWRLLFHSHPRARFLRAELLHAVGRDEEALEWYASFPDPAVIDLEFLAPARLRQAEIEERLGRRDAARAHYAKFLTLWRDPDPGLLPVVARAKQALERLRGAPSETVPQPGAASSGGH